MKRTSLQLLSLSILLIFNCPIVSAQTPTFGAFWEGNAGDHIEMKKYMATDTEDPWCYNQRTFLRVRAWNTKRTTNNYIQLFFWIEDWDNYTASYSDGTGPKEGSWTMNMPGVNYDYNGNPCWMLRLEGDFLNKCLVGYDPVLSDVCAYSSYGASTRNATDTYEGDWNRSDITSFQDYSVKVSVGEGGNIYIEIGSPSKLVATIGKKDTQESVFITLDSGIDFEDNTEVAGDEHFRITGSGKGSNLKQYDMQLWLNWNHKTGTFTEADIDFSQSYFRLNGTDITCTAVFGEIKEVSEGKFELTATLTGADGNVYSIVSSFAHCPKPEPFAGGSLASFSVYNDDDHLQIGNSRFSDATDWYWDAANKFWVITAQTDSREKYNYIQLYFWVDTETELYTYPDGHKGVRPGTYSFQAPQPVYIGTDYWGSLVYSWYVDDHYYNNCAIGFTRDSYWGVCQASSWMASNYYNGFDPDYNAVIDMNKATIVVKEGREGHIYIEIWITPDYSTIPELKVTINEPTREGVDTYKLTVTNTGNGSVDFPTQECDYAEGDRIVLTPMCENGWTFDGWEGTCADQIEDNGDGTYTFTMGTQDCSLTAKCKQDFDPVRVENKIDTCENVEFPFIWRPWSNGGQGIEITSLAQSQTVKDSVWKDGVTIPNDSLFTLQLKLHAPQTKPVLQRDTFFQCEWYDWGSIVLDNGSEINMQEIDGELYETTYSVTEPDLYGCDSTTIHEVIVFPTNWKTAHEYCQSDFYILTTEGDTMPINQCLDDDCNKILDGMEHFRMKIDGDMYEKIYADTIESTICPGEDSIIIDTLRIYPVYRIPYNPGLCADKLDEALARGIPFYGTTITDRSQDGLEYVTEGTVAHGCDSVYVLDLTPIPNDTEYVRMPVCFPIRWKGKTYNDKAEAEANPFIEPDPITGCNRYIFLQPEDGQSVTNSVDSFICRSDLPFVWNEAGGITLNDEGSESYTFQTAGGCDSTVTLNLHIIPTDDIDSTRYVCPGQLPLTWGDMTFDNEGTQTQTVQAGGGCSYTVTRTVRIIRDVIADGDTVCASGLPYTWEGETIDAGDTRFTEDAATGVRTLTLDPKTLPSTTLDGCDSIVQFTLTVIPEQVYDHVTVCESELQFPYTWHVGDQNIEILSLADAANQSVQLTSVLGCDSTVHLDLTVIPTARKDLGTVYIKDNEPYILFPGTSYEKTYTTDTPQEEVVGTGLSYQGCDSVVTIAVVVRNAVEEWLDPVVICADEIPYKWDDKMECYETKEYEFKTRTASGDMDSIVHLPLTVLPHYPDVKDGYTICETELPYTWEGETFTINDTYTDIDDQTYFRQVTKDIRTKADCDSVVTFTLTVHKAYNEQSEITVCRSELPYTWEGETFTDSGSATKTLKTVHECDSVVTFTLKVAEASDTIVEEKLCPGDPLPYVWEGESFYSSGSITKTLRASHGCDSVVHFTLTVLEGMGNVVTDTTVCESELPWQWGTETFYGEDTRTQTFRSTQGCDSTVTLTLHVNPAYSGITDGKTICPDALPYIWEDETFTASETRTKTLHTVLGCDSVVTFTLTVQTPTDETQNETACDNQLPYTWNPTNGYSNYTEDLYDAGTYNYTLPSSLGCDSIHYTLNLTIDRDHLAAEPALTPLETCADDEALRIAINHTAGTPTAYDIAFDQRTGLDSIIRLTIPDDNIIAVPLPRDPEDSTKYLRPDDYSLTLTVYDQCDRKTEYTMPFRILYPSWLIQQRWRDVLALYNDKYNGGYTFSVIRWFKNGTEMTGQGVHNSYIQMSPVLEAATYYTLLTRSDDGKTLRTCDFVPNLASPYYAPQAEKIRLMQQLDPRHITVKTGLSGAYRVYDVTGKQVMEGVFGEKYGNPVIVFSPACADGAYIIRFHADDGTEDTQKWLVR